MNKNMPPKNRNQNQNQNQNQNRYKKKPGRKTNDERSNKEVKVLAQEQFENLVKSVGGDRDLAVRNLEARLRKGEEDAKISETPKLRLEILSIKDQLEFGKNRSYGASGTSTTFESTLDNVFADEKSLPGRIRSVTKEAGDYEEVRQESLRTIGPLIDKTTADVEKIIANYARESRKIYADLDNLRKNVIDIRAKNIETSQAYTKCKTSYKTLIGETKALGKEVEEEKKNTKQIIELANIPLASVTGRMCLSFPTKKGNDYYCKVQPYKTLFGTKNTDKVKAEEARTWLELQEDKKGGKTGLILITSRNMNFYRGDYVYIIRPTKPSFRRFIDSKGREIIASTAPAPFLPENTRFILNPDTSNNQIIGRISSEDFRNVIADSEGWRFFEEAQKNDAVQIDLVFNDEDLYATRGSDYEEKVKIDTRRYGEFSRLREGGLENPNLRPQTGNPASPTGPADQSPRNAFRGGKGRKGDDRGRKGGRSRSQVPPAT